ncbi:hypothetical protein CD805_26100 [Escherichia coli]|nr:hypothetical protein CD805_26100 [Escherichia coli]
MITGVWKYRGKSSKVKPVNQYRLTPVSYATTECRLPYHIICPFPAVQIRFPAEVDPDLICC